MTPNELIQWRTERLSETANNIVNIAVTSIKNWLTASGPSTPKYPPVWSLANEIQGTLPANVNVTQRDINDASAIIYYYYPDFAGVTEIADELSRALAERIIVPKPQGIRIRFLIPWLAFLGIVIVSARER